MPKWARSEVRDEWWRLRLPEVGIFRFFLLFVFSKASYPSGPELEPFDWLSYLACRPERGDRGEFR